MTPEQSAGLAEARVRAMAGIAPNDPAYIADDLAYLADILSKWAASQSPAPSQSDIDACRERALNSWAGIDEPTPVVVQGNMTSLPDPTGAATTFGLSTRASTFNNVVDKISNVGYNMSGGNAYNAALPTNAIQFEVDYVDTLGGPRTNELFWTTSGPDQVNTKRPIMCTYNQSTGVVTQLFYATQLLVGDEAGASSAGTDPYLQISHGEIAYTPNGGEDKTWKVTPSGFESKVNYVVTSADASGYAAFTLINDAGISFSHQCRGTTAGNGSRYQIICNNTAAYINVDQNGYLGINTPADHPIHAATSGTTDATMLLAASGAAKANIKLTTAGVARFDFGADSSGNFYLYNAGASANAITINASNLMTFGGAMKTGKSTTGSRPSASTLGEGAQYYDTTLHKPIWSDGSVWRDAAGIAV